MFGACCVMPEYWQTHPMQAAFGHQFWNSFWMGWAGAKASSIGKRKHGKPTKHLALSPVLVWEVLFGGFRTFITRPE